MKILIIKLGALGDVIRTTAVLPGLKEKYGGCRIDWATKKGSAGFLKNNGLIGKIYLIEDAEKLRHKKYDILISLDDDYEACELASSMPSKKIIGSCLKNGKRMYTDNSSPWFDMGLISRLGKRKADLLKAKNKKTYPEIMYRILGLKYLKQEPMLALGRKELDFGGRFAKKHGIRKSDFAIGINTGAGGRWEDKKLSIEKTAELIDKLNMQIKNARPILFGGPEEMERNKKIKKLAGTGVIDAGCSNSLMEFVSLVNLCDVLVTSDSLALHIGVALKKKVAAFFYPTSSAEIELYGRGIKIMGKGKDYCSYKPKCDYPPEWDVDEFVKAVKKLIKK
ncbi:glycosyltransferase family 9 protein [Candidatus Woesearchaeota archaeon]|nr:glycosyltransferase family 9 protein [Candidatus Woesearchaeota archaeon]